MEDMRDLLNGWRKRHELVELIIPANSGTTEFDFPDIPNLRDDTTQDIIIVGLEVYAVDSMPFSPQGNAVATMAELLNMFLTLYIDEEESIRQLPAVRMQPIWQSATAGNLQGGQTTLSIENVKVVWNKSYWKAAQPPNIGGPNAQFSMMLGVWYKKLQAGMWSRLRQEAGLVHGW